MATPDATAAKRALRRQYRTARRTLDARTRARFDEDIREHIRHAPQFQRAGCFAAYWAFDGEPDLRPLLDRMSARGVAIALPVLGSGRTMTFREWRPGAPLAANRLTIPEPESGTDLALEDLDLVLMPLVAWDRSGRRLGMGGGYYDHLFRAHRDADRPLRVGVAYGVQEAANLPADGWDVTLHAVVTEGGWFTCPA